MSDDVTITEAILRLREQLEKAQKQAVGHDIQFVAKAVEVELTIAFRTSLESKAEAKAWFLAIAGKGKRDDEHSHKIKLILEPQDKSGRRALLSDEGPE
ncbi:trypco2 family protein [Caballeronia sp. KNU42]